MQLRFSQDIHALLDELAERPLTLGDILERTSERGFSLLIALLALPFLIPAPIPGLTSILGSASLLLSGQIALGRQQPWLPAKVARMPFPSALAVRLLQLMSWVSKILERLARPRWAGWANHPRVWQLNGVVLVWLTILLMLPIPATNPIPTTGILVLSVAMLEADGLLMMVCYGFTLLITALLALMAVFGVQMLKQMMDWFWQTLIS
ncbi:MAG: exopolysaccharide biosynthesis protein [Cyanobacteriota bacterium]|nr:exopolysaccharide biosynthesis protein [Cyanobacteriota bacterium]